MKKRLLFLVIAIACWLSSSPSSYSAVLNLGSNTLTAVPFAPNQASPGLIQVAGINQVTFVADAPEPGTLSFNYETKILDANFDPLPGSEFTFTASDLSFSKLSFSSIFNFAPGSGSGSCPALVTASTTYNCGPAQGNPVQLTDGEYTALFSVNMAALLNNDPNPFTVTANKFSPFQIVNNACVSGCGTNPSVPVPEPSPAPFTYLALGLVYFGARKYFRQGKRL